MAVRLAVGSLNHQPWMSILPGMEIYAITPHGRQYWIEAVAEDGTYRQIEAQHQRGDCVAAPHKFSEPSQCYRTTGMAYAPRVAYLMAPSCWRGVVPAIEGGPEGQALSDAVAPITYRFAEEGASMASLKDQLDTIRHAAEGDGIKPGRISPEDLKIMHRVTADQRASGFQARMPKPGQPAPRSPHPGRGGCVLRCPGGVGRW